MDWVDWYNRSNWTYRIPGSNWTHCTYRLDRYYRMDWYDWLDRYNWMDRYNWSNRHDWTCWSYR
jgi:hypothetical protein